MALAQTQLTAELYETSTQEASHTFSSITVPSGALGVIVGGYINDADNENPSLSLTASDAGISASIASAIQVARGTASAYEPAMGVWTFNGNGNASTFTLNGGTGHGRRFVFWPMYFTGAGGIRQTKADTNSGLTASGPYSFSLDGSTLASSITLAGFIGSLLSSTSQVTEGAGWSEDQDVCSNGWMLAHLQQRTGAFTSVPWVDINEFNAPFEQAPVFLAFEVYEAAASSGAVRLVGKRSALKSLVGGGLA